MDVFVEDGCHLSFLDWGDAALRKENENRYIGFVAQSVYSSTSGVPTSGPDDSKLFRWFPGSLPRVASIEKVFKEIPD